MKKSIMILLLFFSFFIFGFNFVKAAEIEIICGTNECITSDFLLIQLKESNISGNDASYSEYAKYFQNYYQSEEICVKEKISCVILEDTYNFKMNWSLDKGFYAYRTEGFDNLTQAIGTASSYFKAGTYVYVLKQTGISSGALYDKTEYIIYVNVTSKLEVGSISARKIKNSSGEEISSEKVTELKFNLTSVYPVSIYNQEADFYLMNKIDGEYSDTTLKTTYNVQLQGCKEAFTANIINNFNEVVGTVNFSDYCYANVTLGNEEALIVPKGTLSISPNSSSVVNYLGMVDVGYQIDSVKTFAKGNGKDLNLESNSDFTRYTFKLGGTGENYVVYTWNYPLHNVPNTGIEITVLPFLIVITLILTIVLLIILTKKRSKSNK